MSTETDGADSVRSDLAFLRALVSDGGLLPAGFGEAYLAGGLIYGFQVLAQWLTTGSLNLSPGWSAVLGLGPTVVFMVVLGAIFWRYRKARTAGGATARAVGATFGAVGLANLALICVIGSVALRRRSLEIWLIYPCVVFVLQGAAWLVAAGMRRRAWQGLVGAGWFAAAIAMALSLGSMRWFALIAGLSLIGLMAVPGAVIMRLSRTSA